MNKTILFLAALTLALLLAVVGLMVLAAAAPFPPDAPLYPLQSQAEQWRLQLTRDQETRTQFAFDLVRRRLQNLRQADDSAAVSTSCQAVELSLARAVVQLGAAPATAQTGLQEQLETLLDDCAQALAGQDAAHPAVSRLQNVVDGLYLPAPLVPTTPAVTAPVPALRIEPAAVAFLDPNINHEDFPFVGGHATVDCLACHPDGLYDGISKTCADCHTYTAKDDTLYPDHFAGACDTCHYVYNWQPFWFDHEGIVECVSCHAADAPEGHYAGVCEICHVETTDWNRWTYDHADVWECESCHLAHTPPDHYAGLCTNCHNDMGDWNIFTFDHTGLTDCVGCHNEAEIPEGHYAGQCDLCHVLTDWETITFDHTGQPDCLACHRAATPWPHYPGACAACHVTQTWRVARFRHTNVMTDCAACHAFQTPPDHYAGACTDCHERDTWKVVNFDHRRYRDCQACHQGDAPAWHYGGQCGACHNEDRWGDAWFSHAGYAGTKSCRDCHQPPAAHYPATCATCHNLDGCGSAPYQHDPAAHCATCHPAAPPPLPSGHACP
ncbi:MAG: cytochrome c3 family protein, partial [Anaerolineales bacterium]|nr:cytochrome c3 family protein [Anaerolineales bacterium]